LGGLIALSLIGFLLMDARSSRFFGGGGRTTVVGVVNGHDIEADQYNAEVNQIEDRYKAQNNGGNRRGDTRHTQKPPSGETIGYTNEHRVILNTNMLSLERDGVKE